MMTEDELLRLVAGLRRGQLERWIRSGWVLPHRDGEHYAFSDVDCARVQLICEMRRDLEVDDETIPVMLSLIDQIHGLRRQLRQLASAVQAQPASVRRNIAARLRRDPTNGRDLSGS